MLSTFSEHIKDVSVLRKLLFAVSQLPRDLPHIWQLAVEFATESKSNATINAETAKMLAENLQELDSLAFESDDKLFHQLLGMPSQKPLGLVLISSSTRCILCESKLQLRKDRHSSVVVYDDNMGTLPGSHFHKLCTNRSCNCTQYYGYYTAKISAGSSSEVYFNADWDSLPYFVSSRETVFSMSALKRFDSGILLGQLSFKQCADIYNHLHHNENTSKDLSK